MTFSVIVPVYNVETYLRQCVDSILAQDCDDYELLLVDDGSTDQSGQLCDEFAAKYEKVWVFHKKNGGLSDARNYGIEHAKGDYLVFIDSDDWVEPCCFSEFARQLKQQKNPDVLITTLKEIYENEIRVNDRELSTFAKENFDRLHAVKWTTEHSKNNWPAQKTIVSRSLVNREGLHFLKGYLHEDIDWTARLCYCAESYGWCDMPWYNHRMGRAGSITGTVKGKRITDILSIAAQHYEVYVQKPDEIHRMVVNRIMKSVYYSMSLAKNCTPEDREKICAALDENRGLFSIAPKPQHRLFSMTLKCFGPRAALDLLKRMD